MHNEGCGRGEGSAKKFENQCTRIILRKTSVSFATRRVNRVQIEGVHSQKKKMDGRGRNGICDNTGNKIRVIIYIAI